MKNTDLTKVKFQTILDILEEVKKTIAVSDESKDDIAVQRMVSFFPKIPFKVMMELYPILLEKDEDKFKEFVEKYPNQKFDVTGTSKYSFSWWEPLIELHDSLYLSAKENPNGVRESMIIAAKELTNLKYGEYNDNTPYQLSNIFEIRYGKKIAYKKSRIIDAYINLRKKFPDAAQFICGAIEYSLTDSTYKALDLILSRVEFALADKKLTHQSNIDYLNQIEIFIKNNLLYCTMKKKVGNMNES